MPVRRAQQSDFESWLILRRKLWPHASDAECQADFERHLENSERLMTLLAENENNEIIGFVEASIREEYVEGCETRRVGYIEGWFVDEKYRRQHVGGKLVAAAENWARQQNCLEMASDCELANEISLQAHEKLGYEIISRNVHFKKWL